MWDGVHRRAADQGKDSPDVLLARIDENIKSLKVGAEVVRLQLLEHEKDDNQKFKIVDSALTAINKTIWIVSGGAGVLVFLINWFHK